MPADRCSLDPASFADTTLALSPAAARKAPHSGDAVQSVESDWHQRTAPGYSGAAFDSASGSGAAAAPDKDQTPFLLHSPQSGESARVPDSLSGVAWGSAPAAAPDRGNLWCRAAAPRGADSLPGLSFCRAADADAK